MADNKQFNFGAIDPITNGIGMLYNIGSGIANQVQNAKNDKWNKAFAEKQFAYQQDLNRQIMEREDNAVQRRAADMQAAGISKNLAAGAPAQAQVMSSGSSGAVAETGFNAKQLQAGELNIMNSYQQFKLQQSEISVNNQKVINMAKELGLLDEETAESKTRQNLNNANINKINQEIKNLKSENINIVKEGAIKDMTLSNLMAQNSILMTENETKQWDLFIKKIRGGENKGLFGELFGLARGLMYKLQGGKNYETEEFSKECKKVFESNELREILKRYGINDEATLYRFLQFMNYKENN